jgi:hypothetical protein
LPEAGPARQDAAIGSRYDDSTSTGGARGGRTYLFVWMIVGWSFFPALTGSFQSPSQAPQIEGSVEGRIVPGSRLTIRMTASPAEGRDIIRTGIELVLREVPLQRIAYHPQDDTIGPADGILIPVGSPGIVAGPFLRFVASDVQAERDGESPSLRMEAILVDLPPPGSAFRFTAIDDRGSRGNLIRLVEPIPAAGPRAADRGGGLTWGTVGLVVSAALFAGGFFGYLFASQKRPTPLPSIYDAIRRRLENEAVEQAAQPR